MTVVHPIATYHYQGLGGTNGLVSINFPASSSTGILLHPEFLMDKILALSSPVPLNPVILDDIIGITRTEDALMVSSPKPRDNAKELCKEIEALIVTYQILFIAIQQSSC